MRSFTFSSKVGRATCLLLGGCLAEVLTAEGVARLALDRVSKIQRRTVNEYWLARTIGNDARADHKHVLMVGNSLLDEDVQFDNLSEALGSHWQARRFVIENTFYFDWYYGLKRLFSEGARPDVVVVTLSTRQWIRGDIRGDYSAFYLMNSRDMASAVHDLGLNATQAANLAFANISKFWGTRAELRNFVLGHLMPDLPQLMHLSDVPDPHPLKDDDVEAIVRGRLARLKALADANGADLVFLLPPVIEVGGNDGSDGFLRAARETGIPTLRPVVSGTLGLPFYRDAGHHLNPIGAELFTERLIPALRNELAVVAADSRIQRPEVIDAHLAR